MAIDPGTAMVGGAILSGAASYIGGSEANKANAREALKNREFQYNMSSTAHQRQVNDLRAAGLNPILSANSGASTPSGAQANIQDAVSPAITTAMDALRFKNEIAALKSQTTLNTFNGEAAKAQAVKDMNSAKNTMLTNTLLEASLPVELKHLEYDKSAAGYDAFMKRFLPATQAVSNIADIIPGKPKVNVNTKPQKQPNKPSTIKGPRLNQL